MSAVDFVSIDMEVILSGEFEKERRQDIDRASMKEGVKGNKKKESLYVRDIAAQGDRYIGHRRLK